MTTTLVWTGVALWIGFSAFVVFGPSAGPAEVQVRHRLLNRNHRP